MAKTEDNIELTINNATETPPKDVETENTDKTKGKEETSSTARTFEKITEVEAREGEDKSTSNFSLSKTLGGVIIARVIQKQIWLVLLITLFMLLYINNRYMCQKQALKIDKLEKELTATRYKATVCTSNLTEKSRESNIINMLEAKGDSTLTIASEPPYLIKVE